MSFELITCIRYAKDPKTKGKEGKTDMDGNLIDPWQAENGVKLITEVIEDDWEEFVTSYKHILLMWYTPYCIRCLEVVKPEFLEVAARISEIRGNVKLAVVDASDEKGLKDRYEVERFAI